MTSVKSFVDTKIHPFVVVLDDNYDKITSFFLYRLVTMLSPSIRSKSHIYAVTFENCELKNVVRVLEEMGQQFSIIRINSEDKRIKDFQHRGHISSAAFLKLLLPSVLPKTIDSCIYADPDILVLKNTDRLFTFPLDENAVLAANVHENMKRTDFPPEKFFDNYNFSFHSGFMYINLKRARKIRFTETCLELLAKTHTLGYADGEILVLACSVRSEVQNVPASLHFVADPVCTQNLKSATPVLVHLEGAGKPWNWPFGGKFRREWRAQYRDWDPSFRLPLSCYIEFLGRNTKTVVYKLLFPIYTFLKRVK